MSSYVDLSGTSLEIWRTYQHTTLETLFGICMYIYIIIYIHTYPYAYAYAYTYTYTYYICINVYQPCQCQFVVPGYLKPATERQLWAGQVPSNVELKAHGHLWSSKKSLEMLGTFAKLGLWQQKLRSGWWFGCHIFYFPRNIGNANHPNWLSYFSEGWPNHQPADLMRQKMGDFNGDSMVMKSRISCSNGIQLAPAESTIPALRIVAQQQFKSGFLDHLGRSRFWGSLNQHSKHSATVGGQTYSTGETNDNLSHVSLAWIDPWVLGIYISQKKDIGNQGLGKMISLFGEPIVKQPEVFSSGVDVTFKVRFPFGPVQIDDDLRILTLYAFWGENDDQWIWKSNQLCRSQILYPRVNSRTWAKWSILERLWFMNPYCRTLVLWLPAWNSAQLNHCQIF